MSYIFPFSVVEKDKEGYYIDRHIQNIDILADTRDEAIKKVKELAGKPRQSSKYYAFYMGNIRPSEAVSHE